VSRRRCTAVRVVVTTAFVTACVDCRTRHERSPLIMFRDTAQASTFLARLLSHAMSAETTSRSARSARSDGVSALAFALLATAVGTRAYAQSREPLCTTVATQRLVRGEHLWTGHGERMAAASFATAGARGERHVVIVPEISDFVSARGSQARPAAALGYGGLGGLMTGASGFAAIRLDDQMHVVDDRIFVADPVATPPENGQSVATLPVAVTLAAGVLVVARHAGDLYATVVPPSGPIAAPRRVATAPPPPERGRRGFEWLTATARADGAIALAGTFDGAVVAIRFDANGSVRGTPALWEERVGGPMELLPSPDGPIAAFLGRPVRGTGPHNEQARVQVLVALNENLRPVGQPFATGFAQFPLAMVRRGRSMLVFQWAEQQGVAIATLPIGDRRFGEQLPRLYYAQPPLEGSSAGHAATVGASNIVFDVANYTETAGGVHGHVTWLAPSGTPYIRRDVLALRLEEAFSPAVFPAVDGVVVVTGGTDETGGAIDAYHVRCDLVSLPQQP
jgi:hypothetical protein